MNRRKMVRQRAWRPADSEAPRAASARAVGGRLLLVTEDDRLRTALAGALRGEGFEVRFAADGFAGLELLRDWLPDLIVLDLDLPIMSGVAFQAHQRGISKAATIPMVAVSNREDLLAETNDGQTSARLKKPCELGTLLSELRQRVTPVPATPLGFPPP